MVNGRSAISESRRLAFFSHASSRSFLRLLTALGMGPIILAFRDLVRVLVRVVIDDLSHDGCDEPELCSDLVGHCGPGERFRILVLGVDVVADPLDQDVDAGERAAPDQLPGDDPEPDLDLVQPERDNGNEMEANAEVLFQPCLHARGGVRGQVVRHDMDLPCRRAVSPPSSGKSGSSRRSGSTYARRSSRRRRCSVR